MTQQFPLDDGDIIVKTACGTRLSLPVNAYIPAKTPPVGFAACQRPKCAAYGNRGHT